eukprot:symbB.v1.2.032225.t1/scaffold3839.1/size96963/4
MALSRVPASMSASCSIFVGNVPYDAQEDELKELFGKVGNVTSVRLVLDKDTKTPKGYAFADFADPASAAVEKLNHVEYNGRKLRIDVGKPRSSALGETNMWRCVRQRNGSCTTHSGRMGRALAKAKVVAKAGVGE